MTLDDLTCTTGEWLRGVGPMSDVVISSRVRLARNLAGFPFLSTASSGDQSEIYRYVADEIAGNPLSEKAFLVDVEETDDIDRAFLVERHLISRQQAGGEGCRGVSIWPDETRAVMINEEDHLRLQALRSGLQLETLWREVSELDDALSQGLEFAFDRQFGYLTACPTNVGTGIRVSVMLHLPALRLTQEIDRVSRATRDMNLAVRGLYGEGTEAIGDLYQVSNQTTLGESEEEILEGFGGLVIPKVVEYERAARESLARKRSSHLDDHVWRAYGILANARRISSAETLTLLSHLRLGIHMGRFDGIDLATLNQLFLQTQPAHLQKLAEKPLDGAARSITRADRLRESLAA
jgi:protein arginine kinase